MSNQEQVVFFLIDDGRDIFILLNEAHRYGLKEAAIPYMHSGESLWKITGAAIPSDQMLIARELS